MMDEEINEVATNEVQVSSTQKELEELTDRYKRILAEFENYKKRSAKERESLYASILSDIVTPMLPVLDNLEKAVEVKTEDEAYKAGIDLVLKQFKDVLNTLRSKRNRRCRT